MSTSRRGKRRRSTLRETAAAKRTEARTRAYLKCARDRRDCRIFEGIESGALSHSQALREMDQPRGDDPTGDPREPHDVGDVIPPRDDPRDPRQPHDVSDVIPPRDDPRDPRQPHDVGDIIPPRDGPRDDPRQPRDTSGRGPSIPDIQEPILRLPPMFSGRMNANSSGQQNAQHPVYQFHTFKVDAPNFTLAPFDIHRGTWGIFVGLLRCTALGVGQPNALVTYNGWTTYSNVKATMIVGVGFGQIRDVVARWDVATNSGYMVETQNAASILIQRVDAGALTNLATFGIPHASTDTIGIRCNSTTIEALLNGAVVASAIDATYTTGRVGLGVNATVAAAFSRFYIERP